MKKMMFSLVAMLSLLGGQAMAQRCLPGMSAVEVRADMVNGFFTGSSRNCGFGFGATYHRFAGHANTWSVGADFVQNYKPYGEKGRIPISQFTAEGGFNLHIVSDYSQTFHLYGGVSALGGYETVNWGKHVIKDGSTLQADDAFIYGGAVSLCADFYLSDNFILGAHVRERFVFGNDTVHYQTSFGVHVKFNLQ